MCLDKALGTRCDPWGACAGPGATRPFPRVPGYSGHSGATQDILGFRAGVTGGFPRPGPCPHGRAPGAPPAPSDAAEAPSGLPRSVPGGPCGAGEVPGPAAAGGTGEGAGEAGPAPFPPHPAARAAGSPQARGALPRGRSREASGARGARARHRPAHPGPSRPIPARPGPSAPRGSPGTRRSPRSSRLGRAPPSWMGRGAAAPNPAGSRDDARGGAGRDPPERGPRRSGPRPGISSGSAERPLRLPRAPGEELRPPQRRRRRPPEPRGANRGLGRGPAVTLSGADRPGLRHVGPRR